MTAVAQGWSGTALSAASRWWAAHGKTVLRLAIVLMAIAAVVWLGYQFWRLLWQSGGPGPVGAIDLRSRHSEVRRWFEGLPVYGQIGTAVYPLASYALLWPFFGWLDLTTARWLWAATTVAALGWLAWLLARESGAGTPLERTFVALAVLSMYAAGATIGNGQLAVHTLPALVAATVLLRQKEGSWRRDLLAAGLFVVALVKPTVSAPFFWLVLFVPGRPRPALLVVLGYVALTLLAASYQDLPPETLLASAVQAGSVMATEASAAAADYASLNSWLQPLGLGQWVLPAALLALLALGLWVYRHRRVDVWLLLGVAALVARLWTYHRWYDDLLILLPMVALFRIGKRAGQADLVALGAWGLLAINWLLTRAPGGQYLLPPPWNGLYVAVLTLSWIAMLAFLLWYAARTGPVTGFGAEWGHTLEPVRDQARSAPRARGDQSLSSTHKSGRDNAASSSAREVALTPTPPRRWFELATDLRFHMFAVLFAFGTILHELEFAHEQAGIGPLTEYMERWSRAIPTIGWSSSVGLGLHLANVAISLLIMALRWRRELVCLLAVTFFLSQPASPDRIFSHSGLMAGVLLVVLGLAVGEWGERLARRRAAAADPAWYGRTLTGIAAICALTYLFALFYKLNPGWVSSNGWALVFVSRPASLVLDPLGLPFDYRPALGALAAYGTLFIELALPVLLFVPRTRLLGCFIGVAFHLPMVARGVADFPALIVACYPAFLGPAVAHDACKRFFARPTSARTAMMVLLGVLALWLIRLPDRLGELISYALELDLHRVTALLIEGGLKLATILLFVHLVLVLGRWLLDGRGGRANDSAKDGPSHVARPTGRGAGRQPLGAMLGGAFVLLVSTAFAINNLGIFLGFPSAGAIYMYSGIMMNGSNHLIIPKIPIGDWSTYATITRFEPRSIDTREAQEFGAFVDHGNARGRPHILNLNHVRYHMYRVCRSAPNAEVGLTLKIHEGETLDFDDACAEPTMTRYLPIPHTADCLDSCGGTLRRWARGAPLQE